MADILSYPEQLKSRPLQGYMVFQEYVRDGRSANNPGKSVYLYMPERLMNPNTVSWDNERLGSLIGPAHDSMRNMASFNMDQFGSSLAQGAMASVLGQISSTVSNMIGKGLSESTAIGITASKVTNPYIVMVFRGIDLRTFEFSFKLYPHNQKERDSIYEIIKLFRGAALPEGSTQGAHPAWLNYPNEFEIEYWITDKDGVPKKNEWLNRFKRSVVVGVDTNYTASGQFSITRDGFPTEIELNLRFTELEIILREDVQVHGY